MKATLGILTAVLLLMMPAWGAMVTVVDERAPLFMEKERKATVYEGMVVSARQHERYGDWYYITIEGHTFTSPKKHYRSAGQLQTEQRQLTASHQRELKQLEQQLGQAIAKLQQLAVAEVQLERDKCFVGEVEGKDDKVTYDPVVDRLTERRLGREWRKERGDLDDKVAELEPQLQELAATYVKELARLKRFERRLTGYQRDAEHYLWQPCVVGKDKMKFYRDKESQILVEQGTVIMARPNFKHTDWRYAYHDGQPYNVYGPYLKSMEQLELQYQLGQTQLELDMAALQRQLSILQAREAALQEASQAVQPPANTGMEYVRVPLPKPPPGRNALYTMSWPGKDRPLLRQSDATRSIRRWEKDLKAVGEKISTLQQQIQDVETERASRQHEHEGDMQEMAQFVRSFRWPR